MSHLYINEESAYSEEIHVTMKSTILHHRKKLNIHLSPADLLHTLLKYEISIGANADITKTKRKK